MGIARFLVTLSTCCLVAGTSPILSSANAMPITKLGASCESLLQEQAQVDASMLRYFRGENSYNERENGTYYQGDRSLRYLPGVKNSKESAALVDVLGGMNFGSHLEIIRRQVGTVRFNKIMESQNPDHSLARAIRLDLQESEEKENVEDAETLKQIIETQHPNGKEPLPENRARQVMAIYERMGRTASTLTEWVEPLVRGKKLKQLTRSALQDPIEKIVRPDTIVYKAMEVTLMLDEPRKFFITAGETGMPDLYHEMLVGAVNLVVPRSRIMKVRSAYFVIQRFIPKEQLYGRIDFVTKGHQKETIASELFDFRER